MTAHAHTRLRTAGTYRTRMAAAMVLSVLLHILLLLPDWYDPEPQAEPSDDPIVLSLVPDPSAEPQARRLVDTAAESERSDTPTNLISDKESAASDASDGETESTAPNVEQGNFEQLGRVAPMMAPPDPQEAVTPTAETEPETESSAQSQETEEQEIEPEPVEAPVQVAAAIPEDMNPKVTPQRPSRPSPAQPENVPPEPSRDSAQVDRNARTQAPVTGEAQNLGFLGHEAMRDEIAPYLKIVRDAVEKRWKIAMQLQYQGTERTKAVLDCSIRPDGTLAYVEIVEAGDSISYAAICKQAVEKAGPFPPFPFEVPEMYRNENLRIRWTFSFL